MSQVLPLLLPMEKQEGKGRVVPSLPTPGGNPNPEKKKPQEEGIKGLGRAGDCL